MAPTHAHETLVVVGLVRAPHVLSAQRSSQQRHCCIKREWREYQRWKPEGPHPALPTQKADDHGEKPECYRASVTEKNAGRIEVPNQEAQCGPTDSCCDHR